MLLTTSHGHNIANSIAEAGGVRISQQRFSAADVLAPGMSRNILKKGI